MTSSTPPLRLRSTFCVVKSFCWSNRLLPPFLVEEEDMGEGSSHEGGEDLDLGEVGDFVDNVFVIVVIMPAADNFRSSVFPGLSLFGGVIIKILKCKIVLTSVFYLQ